MKRSHVLSLLVIALLTMMLMSALAPAAYANTAAFGFDIRRIGWSTFRRDYHAIGGHITVHFNEKGGHAVTVKLTRGCGEGGDLLSSHETRFGPDEHGPKSVGSLPHSTCFKLTMTAPTPHVVRVQGTVGGVTEGQ